MTESVSEMSRPYFERQMRVGRRVIFQWDAVESLGTQYRENLGPQYRDDGFANAEGKIIRGVTFVDEQRAEVFDLVWLETYDPVHGHKAAMSFETWRDAEAWVLDVTSS